MSNLPPFTDPAAITRDLVALPSYEQEAAVAKYIERFLARVGGFTLECQAVAPRRFNLVARTPGPPRLLLAGHMDTVVPKTGWSTDQFALTALGDRLYGLGAYDMKGGIATILAAVAQTGAQPGLMLLFYCDEEYDFAGMRAFLAQEPAGPRPELALIAEPSNGYIWNAHRGLIELHLAVGGRTGHAANPAAGINAITSLADVLRDLAGWLNRFDSPALGRPSLNVAYLRGGLNRGQPGGEVELGRDGNNIADYAEAILDIRPTLPSLRAAAVVAQVQELVTTAKLELLAADIRHDLGALATDPANLVTLEAIVSGGYLDGRDRGYGDGQLIAEAWDIPVAYLGPAGANAHAADEWVSRRSLRQIAQTYTRIIARYTS